LIAAHDLVVVMEPKQEQAVLSMGPAPVVLLPLFDDSLGGGFEHWNIADPFGRPLAAYEHCYRHIDRAVTGLMAAVAEETRQRC
jgi:protein-tyrosine-phosphatase